MVTMKQKKAVENLVESGETMGKVMVDANYSPNTAHTPQKLTESKGFKEEMAKYGLTEKLISSSLVKDIKSKPKQRKPELELGAKILRMGDNKVGEDEVKPEIHLHNTKINIIITEAREKMKEQLGEDE